MTALPRVAIMTLPRRSKLDIILQYEPSWIGEAIISLCMFLWGACMLLSDDYVWDEQAYILPLACIALGIIRAYGLLEFSSIMRSLCAVFSALVWGSLAYGVCAKYGWIGVGGVYGGLAFGELAHVAKFARRDYYFTQLEDSETH